ncbi:relaxase/mobilization nuclease domain-containing protein [Chromobacterium violaceum]|uniref:relaxase/mobilization nuclease domain-containing protein n=1 Tax=Chromobacterium violaceum TaxID=536 RepID=UPI0009F15C12|nr:relaxase/mobilization nuclease domain-containing protein [Chromobacterium violaceum]OQS22714.1 hypothetical protein B0T41_18600 [Chromobacterium violaceum]
MNVTIFPTGTGGAQSAVNYLLSDKDHLANRRAVLPEILYGDPESFVAIANATDRKHKYTSGVIALRDTETLSDRQIDEVIKSFRSAFLPGLEADKNYADFWVAHRDKGNLELHFLYANTELSSGSQLNIHPPGDKNIQFFNTFVSVTNDALGFAQVVPDPLKIALKPFEAKSPKGADSRNAKSDIAAKLHTNILNGRIKDRNQLIGFLAKNDVQVAMVTDDYITVKLPGTEKNKRLKGSLFHKHSDYQDLIDQHEKSKIPKFLTPDESQAQQAKLAQFIKERSDFNHKRYLSPRPGARRANRRSTAGVGVKTVGNSTKTANSPDLKAISSKQQKQLKDIKATTQEKASSADLLAKQIVSKALGTDSEKVKSPSPSDASTLDNGTASLDGKIGSLSLQYHLLLVQLAGAKGQRAQRIRAQIIVIEQKLAALNAELAKTKANQNKKKNDI